MLHVTPRWPQRCCAGHSPGNRADVRLRPHVARSTNKPAIPNPNKVPERFPQPLARLESSRERGRLQLQFVEGLTHKRVQSHSFFCPKQSELPTHAVPMIPVCRRAPVCVRATTQLTTRRVGGLALPRVLQVVAWPRRCTRLPDFPSPAHAPLGTDRHPARATTGRARSAARRGLREARRSEEERGNAGRRARQGHAPPSWTRAWERACASPR